MEKKRIGRILSPMGILGYCIGEDGLERLWFDAENEKELETTGALKELDSVEMELKKELSEYFSGRRREFAIPLAPAGTLFQKQVWEALQQIPYGETRSYKEIAEAIGNPKACRAVGMANNKNPIPIIIPCHRVLGSNGSMVGYAGGLAIKEQLLGLEQKSVELL